MHLIQLLTGVVTLCSLGVAIPVANGRDASPNTSPTPTMALTSASASEGIAAAPSQTMVGPYVCPPKQFKKCCQSLQETSKELMQGLGDVVPILGGVQISSKISFQCASAKETRSRRK